MVRVDDQRVHVAIREQEGCLFFTLDEQQSAVFSEDLVPKMSQLLSAALGREVAVKISIGELGRESPQQLSQRLKRERYSAMVSEFEQDENVRQLMEHFSASVAKDSIAPIND